jgi:hypothetical protein
VAERSEAGWGIDQRVADHLEDALEIPIDLIVPKAQDPETLTDKNIVALRVTSCMRVKIMLTAVNLDDEAMLDTNEIDDEILAR